MKNQRKAALKSLSNRHACNKCECKMFPASHNCNFCKTIYTEAFIKGVKYAEMMLSLGGVNPQYYTMKKIEISDSIVKRFRDFMGEYYLRWFSHLNGITGSYFPVIKLSKRKSSKFHFVYNIEGKVIIEWMIINIPSCRIMSYDKLRSTAIDLLSKAIEK